jgi:hypothetical protein
MTADLLKQDKEHILAGMHRLLGNNMKFYFSEVEKIPRSKSGKFKWVVSKLTQPH